MMRTHARGAFALSTLALMIGALAVIAFAAGRAQADGNGSPTECLHTNDPSQTPSVEGSIGGSDDLVSSGVLPGTVEYVCIKAGGNPNDGEEQHSGPLVDGTY